MKKSMTVANLKELKELKAGETMMCGRVPDALAMQIKVQAVVQSKSLQAIMEEALRQWLKTNAVKVPGV